MLVPLAHKWQRNGKKVHVENFYCLFLFVVTVHKYQLLHVYYWLKNLPIETFFVTLFTCNSRAWSTVKQKECAWSWTFQHKSCMKWSWFELREYRWNGDVRPHRSSNRNLSKCKILARIKKFQGSNGIWIHGLCVSAAVLYQLWRPIYWELTNLSSSSLPVTAMRREMKLIWTAGVQIKWRCDHGS